MLSKYVEWSKLDPLPVLWYNEEYQEWFAVWNEIEMIAEHAWLLCGFYFWGYAPTPEMKQQASQKFTKLYFAGAFGFENTEKDSKWGHIIRNHQMYTYYCKNLGPYIRENADGIPPYQVFERFDKFVQHKYNNNLQ